MLKLKNKFLMGLAPFLMAGTQIAAPAAYAGGESSGGGGGDGATEMRIDEIRLDIFKWLNEGGGHELVLPNDLSHEVYRAAMSRYLERHAVVIGSVTTEEEDAATDAELKVWVAGQRKTCRGFVSLKDKLPHILCNVERFKETSEAEQYRLIHHEYAGLAMVERNVGASSDYSISNQLTDYLVPEKVMRLAVRKPKPVIEEVSKEEEPMLADAVSGVWEQIKNGKVRMEVASGMRSTQALIGVKLTVQAVTIEEQKKDNGELGRIVMLPLWLSVDFDPSHPSELAYARLRGAAFLTTGESKNTRISGRLLEAYVVGGLEGKTKVTGGFNVLGIDIAQYLSIDRDGKAQLYLRGAANLSLFASNDTLRSLDMSDDSSAPLSGDVGIRLWKRLLVSGNAQLRYFGSVAQKVTDPDLLKGVAPQYGGRVDLQFKDKASVFGRVSKMNTSNLDGAEGTKSVVGFFGGIQLNFH